MNSIYGEVYYRAGDHQMVRPVPVMVGKKPNEMKNPDDFFQVLELVPGEQALPPLDKTGCKCRTSAPDRPGHNVVFETAPVISGPSYFEVRFKALPMPTLPQFLSQAFNGIALGSLLALIASGLSIILGTLGVLNFAHGAMFMLGAYVGFVVLGHWKLFAAAMVLGALVLLLVGLATERGLIRFYYRRPPEDQILVTFGLGIMIVEGVRYVFGPLSQRVPLPSWGQGIVNFGFSSTPLPRPGDWLRRGHIVCVLRSALPHPYRSRSTRRH